MNRKPKSRRVQRRAPRACSACPLCGGTGKVKTVEVSRWEWAPKGAKKPRKGTTAWARMSYVVTKISKTPNADIERPMKPQKEV
jgi:hypothetical protein